MKGWQWSNLVIFFLLIFRLQKVQGVDESILKCLGINQERRMHLHSYGQSCLSYSALLHIESSEENSFTIQFGKVFNSKQVRTGISAQFYFGNCLIDMTAVPGENGAYLKFRGHIHSFGTDAKIEFHKEGYSILDSKGAANGKCSPFALVQGGLIYVKYRQDVTLDPNLVIYFDPGVKVEMIDKLPPKTTSTTTTTPITTEITTVLSTTDSTNTTEVPITEASTTAKASSTSASDSSSKPSQDTPTPVIEHPTQEPKTTSQDSTEEPKDNGKAGLIIGLLLAALIVILGGSGLIGFICFRKHKEKKTLEREEQIARLHKRTDDSKGTEKTRDSRGTERTEQTKGTERSKSQGSQLSKESKITEPSKDESKESKGEKANEKPKQAKK